MRQSNDLTKQMRKRAAWG